MPRAILIGPPGSGKSSVGKALSRELSLSFQDSDALIVEQEGRSIPEIFAAVGESGFRTIEREVVLGALGSEVGVLSLGGGAILDEYVQRALLSSHAEIIFLRIGLSQVLSRIGVKGERPLLTGDPEGQWVKLFKAREPIYRSLASIEIATDNKKPNEVAHELRTLMEWSVD